MLNSRQRQTLYIKKKFLIKSPFVYYSMLVL